MQLNGKTPDGRDGSGKRVPISTIAALTLATQDLAAAKKEAEKKVGALPAPLPSLPPLPLPPPHAPAPLP